MQLDGDAFKLKRMMRQDAHEKAFEIQVMGQKEAESISEQHYVEDKRKAEKQHEKMRGDALINHKKAIAQANT